MTVEEKGSSFKVICDDITKSEGDDRLYRGLVLQNDMKILVVSDSSTEKAAASMDVHIGKGLQILDKTGTSPCNQTKTANCYLIF